MRVLFVGSHLSDKQYSIYGFEQALAAELQGRCEFRVVRPGHLHKAQDKSKWARYLDKYLVFPRILRRESSSYDIVHFCEKGMALNLPVVKGRPTLATIHDFMAVRSALGPDPEWRTGWKGRHLQRMILQSVRQATGVACVSDTTRQEMKTYLYGYKGQVETILNGSYKNYKRLEPHSAIQRLDPGLNITPRGYYMHIGGNKPYKNREGVLKIYKEILNLAPGSEHALVMCGSGKTDRLIEVERNLGLLGRVIWIKEPDDDVIEALYSLARALIFPSTNEGFGLPIVEAQSCGCPVFTTNRRPMTEIGGDAAVYFDCTDPLDGANQVLAHKENLAELSRKGLENAKRFDRKVMADKYLDFYEKLVRC